MRRCVPGWACCPGPEGPGPALSLEIEEVLAGLAEGRQIVDIAPLGHGVLSLMGFALAKQHQTIGKAGAQLSYNFV